MCIESASKLSEQEEASIKSYFNSYEYAISINKHMRGKGAIDERYAHCVAKESVVIRKAIKEKGLVLTQDLVLYRAMAERFDNSDSALPLSRQVPAGATTTCLISMASSRAGANFGGSRCVYQIVVPRGERCVRREWSSIGVGTWYEYLFGPGDIVYFGNYAQIPDTAIPVVYVHENEGKLSEEDFKRLLRMAGMRDFSAPSVPTVSTSSSSSTVQHPDAPLPTKYVTLPSGEKVPFLLNNSDDGRLMVFPWGVEQTFGDKTVRIFDMRRGASLLKMSGLE